MQDLTFACLAALATAICGSGAWPRRNHAKPLLPSAIAALGAKTLIFPGAIFAQRHAAIAATVGGAGLRHPPTNGAFYHGHGSIPPRATLGTRAQVCRDLAALWASGLCPKDRMRRRAQIIRGFFILPRRPLAYKSRSSSSSSSSSSAASGSIVATMLPALKSARIFSSNSA